MGDKLDEQTSEQNVYDDVFKSLISKCPQLLIPVINEVYDYLKDIFDFPESQRESYRQKLADTKEALKPKANKKTIKAMRR